MYDGAWTTTPTMGTVSSEKRNGASSIPRKRDFAFISHQREMPGDLVHDRIRSRADSDARHRPWRKLRQSSVLYEGRRQVHRTCFRLKRSEFGEGPTLDDDLLLALRDPFGEPFPMAGFRLECRHDRGVRHLDGQLPAREVEVRAHRDHEFVIHVSLRSIEFRGPFLFEFLQLRFDRPEFRARLVTDGLVVGLRVRPLERHAPLGVLDRPAQGFALLGELLELEPYPMVSLVFGH